MKFISFILISLSFVSATDLFGQKNTISDYKSYLNSFSNSFASNVKDEDDWSQQAGRMSSVIEDAEEDLKAGSGLSFQEMNELRSIKKYLDAIYVVGQSINPDNKSHFNKRSLRYLKEVVYGISFDYQFSELNVDVYRFQIDNYVVFLFYFGDGDLSSRTIGWKKLNEPNCGSIMGKLSVPSGVYKQFWNNSACLNRSNFKFKVMESTFLMSLNNMRSFYDDIPYTD